MKRTKCNFMLPSVEYLGYHISGEVITLTREKHRAVVDATVPQDLSQPKSFLGLRKIPALSCRYFGATIQATHQKATMALGSGTGQGIPEG